MHATLDRAVAERSALAARSEVEGCRQQLTDEVVLRLIRGQQSLVGAVREVEQLFRELHPGYPDIMRRFVYDGTTSDRAAVTCYVVGKVRSHPRDDSSRRHEVWLRLRAELGGLALGPADHRVVLHAVEQSAYEDGVSGAAR